MSAFSFTFFLEIAVRIMQTGYDLGLHSLLLPVYEKIYICGFLRHESRNKEQSIAN